MNNALSSIGGRLILSQILLAKSDLYRVLWCKAKVDGHFMSFIKTNDFG